MKFYVSVKNIIGILIGIVLKLQTTLNSFGTFTILNILVYDMVYAFFYLGFSDMSQYLTHHYCFICACFISH